jgi:hypothetical protein
MRMTIIMVTVMDMVLMEKMRVKQTKNRTNLASINVAVKFP